MSDVDSMTMARRVRAAVMWRSGSQVAAQLVTWTSTFFVIRVLEPADYGLYAMTQVILSLLMLLNGYSFTGALVQAQTIDRRQVAQVFGVLILMNFTIAAIQFVTAPLAAAWFRAPALTDLLRVLAAAHLTTPFVMVPQALLSHRLDFRTQARANIAAAIVSAIVAPACALAGFGVWTLVLAPMSLFYTRALMLFVLGRWWVRPSFRFAGQSWMGFGMAMLVYDVFWFIQSQADVFLAGRTLPPHEVGIYTTALFLAQLLTAKFIPALNEVAFPSYARLQDDRAAVAAAFVKAVRLIMLAAVPFAWGLAVAAEPLVLTVLGPKWSETIPVVRLLGIAMPFAALPIIYAPATNALNRPAVAAWVAGAGALIMPACFLAGVRYGAPGLAAAWLVAAPLLALAATHVSLPVVGVRAPTLLAALRPAVLAGLVMVASVFALDAALPALPPFGHLVLLVATGVLGYGAALLVFARATLIEFFRMLRPAAV
jgi:O-antigen/teichoic acid export membrane protein